MTNYPKQENSNVDTVRQIMTKNLVTIEMGETIGDAYSLMVEKRIRHLPVVDELECIVGIVSQRDIASISKNNGLAVEFFMSNPVEYVHQNTPLKTAIHRMLEKKISCLLISNNDEDAVGIVTTDDLLGYLVRLIEKKSGAGALLSLIDITTVGGITNELSEMGI